MSNLITIVKPHVKILGHTEDMLKLLEKCGRVCYKSESKIVPGSAGKFIRAIIKSGHESVIEHASVTCLVVGSRSWSHQQVRHRLAAYSQESQRYCDYSKQGEDEGLKVILPPTIGELPEATYWTINNVWGSAPGGGLCSTDIRSLWLEQIDSAYTAYLRLREEGIPAEDARSVLPNATKTEIAITYNLRVWRHIFEHRGLNSAAQWEIRELMKSLLDQFAQNWPWMVEDLLP